MGLAMESAAGGVVGVCGDEEHARGTWTRVWKSRNVGDSRKGGDGWVGELCRRGRREKVARGREALRESHRSGMGK